MYDRRVTGGVLWRSALGPLRLAVRPLRFAVGRVLQQRHLNYLLTNHVPRRRLTLWMARFARIRHPLVRGPSIAAWKFFADVDLGDARKQRFESLHDCFIRELRPGARLVDADPRALVSPCDAIVGALGVVTGGTVLQAKGRSYPLAELLNDADLARCHEGGSYVTLRLTAGMYHRFHAPDDCMIEQVDYIPGDTWNVNPPTLARVERLYCRNERAVVHARLADGGRMTLVPVAAILVASIRLHCLRGALGLRYDGPGRHRLAARYLRGAELGWFEHGSTIIVFMPPGCQPLAALRSGQRVRMGQVLWRHP